MSKETSVTATIEAVKSEICDNYCKYLDVIKCVQMSDEEYSKWLEEHCEKCPLDRL